MTKLKFMYKTCSIGSKGIGNRFEEQRLTLRIHRGRGSNYHESPHSNGSTHSTTTSLGNASPERLSRFTTRKHEKVKISVSYPSSENISSPTNNQTSNQLYAVHYTVNGKETQASHLFRGNSTSSRRSSSININNNNKDFLSVTSDKVTSPRASKKMGKRNIKAQVKKFRMETKGEFQRKRKNVWKNKNGLRLTTFKEKRKQRFKQPLEWTLLFQLKLLTIDEIKTIQNFCPSRMLF